jgi:ADP-heptose:LPS heptosyltransferase
LLFEQGVVDAVLPAAGLEPLTWEGPAPEVAVNLHGSGPESHRLLARVRPGRLVAFACPVNGFTDGPQWDAGEHEVRRWIRLAAELGGSASLADLRLDPPSGSPPHPGAVVVHPGAAFGSRRWPVERWRTVVASLADTGLPVVVTGTSGERDLTRAVAEVAPAVVDLGGKLTPRELAQLVGAARLLLSADTGVAHLATAYGTPSVTLFGPTDPALWGPLVDPDVHEVMWAGKPEDPPGEPRGSRLDPRLGRITPPEVLARAAALLTRSPVPPA